jgi:hypothetical protein
MSSETIVTINHGFIFIQRCAQFEFGFAILAKAKY